MTGDDEDGRGLAMMNCVYAFVIAMCPRHRTRDLSTCFFAYRKQYFKKDQARYDNLDITYSDIRKY